MTPSPDDLDLAAKQPAPAPDDSTHPDPLTGEPGAHPVGVGIGAVGTGVAGAVIGSLAGPVGAVIGAAIGAIAGGLAGKEVAGSDDDLPSNVPPSASTPAGAGAVLPGAGMSGMSGMYDASLPAAALVGGTERGVAGSNIDETTGIGAGQFHDAFTATTLRETEEENRLLGDDAPDSDLEVEPGADEDLMEKTAALREEQHLPGGEAIVGGTPLGRANERHTHICTAAYYLYLAREGVGGAGDALGDWLTAEREFPME